VYLNAVDEWRDLEIFKTGNMYPWCKFT